TVTSTLPLHDALPIFAFGLSIGVAKFHTNANAEYFMLLPLVAGLVTFTLGHQTGRLPWFLLSGVLNGIAIMTKEVGVFNLAFLRSEEHTSELQSRFDL